MVAPLAIVCLQVSVAQETRLALALAGRVLTEASFAAFLGASTTYIVDDFLVSENVTHPAIVQSCTMRAMLGA